VVCKWFAIQLVAFRVPVVTTRLFALGKHTPRPTWLPTFVEAPSVNTTVSKLIVATRRVGQAASCCLMPGVTTTHPGILWARARHTMVRPLLGTALDRHRQVACQSRVLARARATVCPYASYTVYNRTRAMHCTSRRRASQLCCSTPVSKPNCAGALHPRKSCLRRFAQLRSS